MSWIWSNSPYKGERLLLHLALGDFANDQGECFPSVATLAKKARCSDVWCRAGIRQMIEDDLIEIVKPGVGRGRSNLYRLKRGRENVVIGLPSSENAVSLATKWGKSDDSLSSNKNRHESSFEIFWSAYPRKVAKGAARKAFIKAMSRDDAPTIDSLLAAIKNYEKTITDARFIAHPATWLNGERWLDSMPGENPAKVETNASRSAASFGAALALIGKTENDLIEQIDHYSPEHQAAALEAFREARRSRT
jgi:hypothetical protein